MKNRSQRLKSFLVVCLTMISCVCVQGQRFYKMGINKDFSKLTYPGTLSGREVEKRENTGVNLSRDALFIPQTKKATLYIPSNIFYTQSGIMCKSEWQLEKATHIPFRFRLGSLADCNALEGKR